VGLASACIPLFFKRGGHDYPGNRGYPAKKQRDASKNRSHNPKTADTKLLSFFSDQTGCSPAGGLKPDTRNLLFFTPSAKIYLL
jgi:hypothetical protein